MGAPPQRAADGAAARFDALWTLRDGEWARRPATGPAPCSRSDASVCRALVRKRPHLVVFGGFAPGLRRPLGGLHALDLERSAWTALAPDDLAPPRPRKPRRAPPAPEAPPRPATRQVTLEQEPRGPRTATEAIFGEPDSDADSEAAFDDMAPAEAVRSAALGLRSGGRRTDRYEAGPHRPKPRAKGERRARELWGGAPSPRAGHTMTAVGADLVVFGGLGRLAAAVPAGYRTDYLNETWLLRAGGGVVWRRPEVRGERPHVRSGHAALGVGPHVVVFGGVSAHRFLNDLHVLHVPSLCWSSPALAGPRPSPRMRPALAPAPGGCTFYLFGGTRAWGAAAAVATATARHDGDLFAITLAPAPEVEEF